MKCFYLVRHKDISGVSGTGIVAEGVEFDDGQVAVSWFGRYHGIEIMPSVADYVAVHGHDGATELVWEGGRSYEE